LTFANKEKPIAEEIVPMATTISYKRRIFVMLFPLFFMP
jgi:hypothetical protein